MKTATNIFSQALGLMFRTRIEPLCFIFRKEKIHAIHSFFVFSPFEAIYLDADRRVVELRHVKPFRLNIRNKQPAKYLIEAPVGWARRNKIKKGCQYLE